MYLKIGEQVTWRSLIADPALANQLLDWKTTKTLDIMCADHWHWQQKNPQGYES